MMKKQNGQIQRIILDIDSMILDAYFLRQIKDGINFDFIYEKAFTYHSDIRRKSINLVALINLSSA